MSQKSVQGKTNKYQGVVKSVQKNQPQEEPRITPDQIRSAFSSFGFNVNERNHDDIGYWSTKPKSELPKLVEELHKRRIAINTEEDNDRKTQTERERAAKKAEEDRKAATETLTHKQQLDKVAMPRLSDEDINALFDEYGLPSPDPEWARSHLPNDPKKIRSILEMQRKTADDMLKIHSKNAVNQMPAVPKAGAGAPMGGMGGYYGRGGPQQGSPMGMQGGMVGGDEPVTPFFVGENALVKIVNPNDSQNGTYWLVDTQKKVMRPILSTKALETAFEDPQEAIESIITLSSKALAPGGPLEGFTPLKMDKGMKDDGSMDDIEFSPAQLQNRYGQQENPEAENKALSMLDGVMGSFNKQQQ